MVGDVLLLVSVFLSLQSRTSTNCKIFPTYLFAPKKKKKTSICKSGVGVDVGGRGKHKSLDIHNLTSQKERDPRTKYWVKVIGGIQKDGGVHEPIMSHEQFF